MTSSEMRWELARLDPGLVHPSLAISASRDLRAGKWEGSTRVYAETLVAMADSDRMPEEFAAALALLNPLLDVRLTASGEDAVRLDARAAEILRQAQGVRDARSGMACDFCLGLFDVALDDARKDLGLPDPRPSASPPFLATEKLPWPAEPPISWIDRS